MNTDNRPVSYVGGVSLHTLPDMTPEPTAEEVVDWLTNDRWTEDRTHWLTVVSDVLDARDALIAERETPPQFVPHVLLPADWAVYYTRTVTVTANDPEASGGQPHPIDLTRELRDELGLFSGAMPCTPKEAWDEAIKAVKTLRSGWCWKCMEKDSNLADPAPTGDDDG